MTSIGEDADDGGMSRGRRRRQRGAIGLFRDRRRRPRGDVPAGAIIRTDDDVGLSTRARRPGTTGGGAHGGRRRPPSFVVRGRGPDDARLSGRGTLRTGAPMPRDAVLRRRPSISAPPARVDDRDRRRRRRRTPIDYRSPLSPPWAHGPITTRGSTIIVEIAIVDYRVAIGRISNHDATSDLPRRNRNTTTKI
jgi:hypothetical protein